MAKSSGCLLSSKCRKDFVSRKDFVTTYVTMSTYRHRYALSPPRIGNLFRICTLRVPTG
jgi:hypothetical protein